MTPRVFYPTRFVSDFVTALDRLERWAGSRPAYPAAPWHRALCEAEESDQRRSVRARYLELDAGQVRVRYYERLECSGEALMNGKPLRLFAAESEVRGRRGRPPRVMSS